MSGLLLIVDRRRARHWELVALSFATKDERNQVTACWLLAADYVIPLKIPTQLGLAGGIDDLDDANYVELAVIAVPGVPDVISG